MNQEQDPRSINRKIANLLSFDSVSSATATVPEPKKTVGKPKTGLELSFIFFSDINQGLSHKYQLAFELTDFADQHGFSSVWLPERHFHPFGGIYPNPAVLASALAVRTKNVRLRTGSVVLTLHHPIDVVESWAMVDHLSGGRVDLGFASGWNPNDFILSPDTFKNLRQVWFDRIPIVEKLWRGESMSFPNGKGELTEIQIYPKPLQKELNVWLVVSKSDDSFRYAGSKGYNVLTMLQGIDLDKMAEKIKIYRKAREEAGLDPEAGIITLMMHTLVHKDLDIVRNAVRAPFFDYIKSALRGHMQTLDADKRPNEQEMHKMVEYSYERYFSTGALFGSAEDVEPIARKAQAIGVNEIACLMDFGPDYGVVKESLPYLKEFKEHITKA